MPTVTVPLPPKMSEKQRTELLAHADQAFDRLIVCLDHGKKPSVEIKGGKLSCEVCCEELAMLARMLLPKIARDAAGRS
jgi:hypothetical protein